MSDIEASRQAIPLPHKFSVESHKTFSLGRHGVIPVLSHQPKGINELVTLPNFIAQERIPSHAESINNEDTLVAIGVGTHEGIHRAGNLNEDRIGYARIEGLPEGEEQFIVTTPDGIGGHVGGQIAAAIAKGRVTRDEVQQAINNELTKEGKPTREIPSDLPFRGVGDWYQEILQHKKNYQAEINTQIQKRWQKDKNAGIDMKNWTQPHHHEMVLAAAVQRVNKEVYDLSQITGMDMGTTLPAALLMRQLKEDGTYEWKAYIANVGDSRVYIYYDTLGKGQGELKQITEDHSLVTDLVNGGIIQPDDVFSHPRRNQIFRSLGHKPEVDIDTYFEKLARGDRVLLCTDGLWEMVQERSNQKNLTNTINNAVSVGGEPWRIAGELIKGALDGGGLDNVTVAVVEIPETAIATSDKSLAPMMQQSEFVLTPEMKSAMLLSPHVREKLQALAFQNETMKTLHHEEEEARRRGEYDTADTLHTQLRKQRHEFTQIMFSYLQDTETSFREHPNILPLVNAYNNAAIEDRGTIVVALRKETERLIKQIKSLPAELVPAQVANTLEEIIATPGTIQETQIHNDSTQNMQALSINSQKPVTVGEQVQNKSESENSKSTTSLELQISRKFDFAEPKWSNSIAHEIVEAILKQTIQRQMEAQGIKNDKFIEPHANRIVRAVRDSFYIPKNRDNPEEVPGLWIGYSLTEVAEEAGKTSQDIPFTAYTHEDIQKLRQGKVNMRFFVRRVLMDQLRDIVVSNLSKKDKIQEINEQIIAKIADGYKNYLTDQDRQEIEKYQFVLPETVL